jgi:hypothetical protein
MDKLELRRAMESDNERIDFIILSWDREDMQRGGEDPPGCLP